MEYNLRTQKFDLFWTGSRYKAHVFDKNLARNMNKLIKSYPEQTIFQVDEEAIFTFPESMLDNVKIALRIRE